MDSAKQSFAESMQPGGVINTASTAVLQSGQEPTRKAVQLGRKILPIKKNGGDDGETDN